jgi:hypothetical protein
MVGVTDLILFKKNKNFTEYSPKHGGPFAGRETSGKNSGGRGSCFEI